MDSRHLLASCSGRLNSGTHSLLVDADARTVPDRVMTGISNGPIGSRGPICHFTDWNFSGSISRL